MSGGGLFRPPTYSPTSKQAPTSSYLFSGFNLHRHRCAAELGFDICAYP
jgi:hypothetical protein